MSITNTEIGSGLPGAAEVEPPAAVLHAGGSIAEACLRYVKEARAHNVTRAKEKIQTGESARDERLIIAIMDRILEASGVVGVAAPNIMPNGAASMGVTGNAILLLGYAGGCLHGTPDPLYAVEEADPRAGTLQVRRHGTDNIYQISVVQLEGIE